MSNSSESIEIKIPHKMCSRCNYLFEWEENMEQCHKKAYCPSNKYTIILSLDKEQLACLLADMLKLGDDNVNPKDKRVLMRKIAMHPHSIEILALAQSKLINNEEISS